MSERYSDEYGEIRMTTPFIPFDFGPDRFVFMDRDLKFRVGTCDDARAYGFNIDAEIAMSSIMRRTSVRNCDPPPSSGVSASTIAEIFGSSTGLPASISVATTRRARQYAMVCPAMKAAISALRAISSCFFDIARSVTESIWGNKGQNQ